MAEADIGPTIDPRYLTANWEFARSNLRLVDSIFDANLREHHNLVQRLLRDSVYGRREAFQNTYLNEIRLLADEEAGGTGRWLKLPTHVLPVILETSALTRYEQIGAIVPLISDTQIGWSLNGGFGEFQGGDAQDRLTRLVTAMEQQWQEAPLPLWGRCGMSIKLGLEMLSRGITGHSAEVPVAILILRECCMQMTGTRPFGHDPVFSTGRIDYAGRLGLVDGEAEKLRAFVRECGTGHIAILHSEQEARMPKDLLAHVRVQNADSLRDLMTLTAFRAGLDAIAGPPRKDDLHRLQGFANSKVGDPGLATVAHYLHNYALLRPDTEHLEHGGTAPKRTVHLSLPESTHTSHSTTAAIKKLARKTIALFEYGIVGLTRFYITPRILHRWELRRKIRDMPFIYRDLAAEIIDDRVEPTLVSLEIDTRRPLQIDALQPVSTRHVDTDTRIRNYNRLLVVGKAGMGKTTFLRFEILRLLSDKGRSSRFRPGEDLLPFYVPLKALDTSAPKPILRYLLAHNFCLAHHGLIRLTKLATSRELLLCLDGYDELFLANDPTDPSRDHLQDELALVFQSDAIKKRSSLSTDEAAFYRALQPCRVWISSRMDFFLRHLIPITDEAEGPKHVAAVELLGISNNRYGLADRIFEKYRKGSVGNHDLLSAKYFIGALDKFLDDELSSLSNNPLFLTIMAHNYAGNAIASGTRDVPLAHSLPELVLEFISYLLIDIDEAKTRGLGLADKAAYLSQRNDYLEEKKAFLYYFASRLIYERTNVFSLSHIREHVVRFFGNGNPSPSREIIIRQTAVRNSRKPDLAQQLADDGLFVSVDRQFGTTTYDFPHRRFREVLAAQYFDARPDRQELFEAWLNQPDLTEQVYIIFSISAAKDEIVAAILSHVRGASDLRCGDILVNCLEQAGTTYDASGILWQFFLQCMEESTLFQLPDRILAYLQPAETIIKKVAHCTAQALENADLLAGALGCAILRQKDSRALVTVLQQYLSTHTHDVNSTYVVYQSLVLLQPDYVIDHLNKWVEEPAMASALYCAIAGLPVGAEGLLPLCRRILQQLGTTQSIIFLRTIDQINKPLIAELLERNLLSERQEKLLVVSRHSDKITRENTYAITRSVLSQFDYRVQEQLRSSLWHILSLYTVSYLHADPQVRIDILLRSYVDTWLYREVIAALALVRFVRPRVPTYFGVEWTPVCETAS